MIARCVEYDGASLAPPPCLWSSQSLPHQDRAEFIQQLCMKLMAVREWHSVQRGQGIRKRRSECHHAGGDSIPAGAGRDWSSGPANRSMASTRECAALSDSLHLRCLTSNWLDSGSGSVAFLANKSSRSAEVHAFLFWHCSSLGPDRPAEGVAQYRPCGFGAGDRRGGDLRVHGCEQIPDLIDGEIRTGIGYADSVLLEFA